MLSLMTPYKMVISSVVNFQHANSVMQKVGVGELLNLVHLSSVSLKEVGLALKK